MCLLAFSADWFSDGIFRKKGLEFSKPFVLRMDYWFLRMISSSWGIGL